MNLPRNVFRFEVLLYASLMLDALSVAVQDRTPTGDMTDQTIMAATLVAGGMTYSCSISSGSPRATARTGRAGCWRQR